MQRVHKVLLILIFVAVLLLAYLGTIPMSDTTAQSLVVCFSIIFGFHIASVAILYSASYTKKLHDTIDEKQQKRGTQILKSYLLTSGYFYIVSILSVIVFTAFATETINGVLSVHPSPFLFPVVNYPIPLNLFLTSALYGISAVNFFYMLLVLHMILKGMVQEAKGIQG